MKRTITALILSVILSSGCSIYHVSSVDTSDEYYPSKQRASDVVHLERIDRPHEIIGQVVVNTERRQRHYEVIEKMKREAAILGGDAITNIHTDASGAWKKLPAQDVIGNAYVRANYSAAVVVFK